MDACADHCDLRTMLIEQGHDVVSATEKHPGATDEALLALAYEEQRVLVTEDKDFGELVFLRGLPHPSIVRFAEMPVVQKVAAMRRLIERHPDALREGAIVVVRRHLVRIRFTEPEGRSDD